MELEPDGIVPPDIDGKTGRDPVVQRIETMLDEERFEEALEAIQAALASGDGNALDLTFLLGDAYLSLGRAAEAEAQFRQVLEADPDCPSSRCWLAMSLFLQWRFDEAEPEAKLARSLPDAIVDAHVVYGSILERRERLDEAEACFERAAALAPDKYPKPVRMTRQEVDRQVRLWARNLPRQVHPRLRDSSASASTACRSSSRICPTRRWPKDPIATRSGRTSSACSTACRCPRPASSTSRRRSRTRSTCSSATSNARRAIATT